MFGIYCKVTGQEFVDLSEYFKWFKSCPIYDTIKIH